MKVLVGVDVGTTGVRAGAFNAKTGELLFLAGRACSYETPHSGWAEADPETWWNAAAHVLNEMSQTISSKDVAAVAVVGQAPTAVMVNSEGKVVRPAILWLDTRAQECAEALSRTLGEDRARAFGGNRLHAYFLGPKVAWACKA